MRIPLILIALIACSPAQAQEDQPGPYIGLDSVKFEAEFEKLPLTGDGTGIGLHVGYRHDVDDRFFLEAETFYMNLNGETTSGLTKFNSHYGVTVGGGAYFSERLSGSLFAGFGKSKASNAGFGSETGDNTITGFGLGYDLTPKDSISLRYSRVLIDTSAGDINTDVLVLRYSHRF